MLSSQYEKEQAQLLQEIEEYKTIQERYEKERNSTKGFLALVKRYEKFEELSTVMLNEFVEKIVIHERDRKGKADTTQKVEIYFNLIGQFVPPTMEIPELTPEELEALQRKEERKNRLHQNYLKRKAYEERVKAKKKTEIEVMKEAERFNDKKKGIYYIVSDMDAPVIPKAESSFGIHFSDSCFFITRLATCISIRDRLIEICIFTNMLSCNTCHFQSLQCRLKIQVGFQVVIYVVTNNTIQRYRKAYSIWLKGVYVVNPLNCRLFFFMFYATLSSNVLSI